MVLRVGGQGDPMNLLDLVFDALIRTASAADGETRT
jgi:hypothetical protein